MTDIDIDGVAASVADIRRLGMAAGSDLAAGGD
jgi:hypothetical protein